MGISKAPTLRLKALKKHNRTHIKCIEAETAITFSNSYHIGLIYASIRVQT